MGRENLVKWDSNSIFYKSLPGSGSLWGSLLSKIALYPSRWSLKSTVISWNAGSAERVMQSPHPLSESQSGEGLGSSVPLFVPPEMKKRHSSGSMSPSFIMILRHSTGHQMTLGFEKKNFEKRFIHHEEINCQQLKVTRCFMSPQKDYP